MKLDIYAIPNTFTPDFSLDKQIQLGISDWVVEGAGGHCSFGHTREEAIANYNLTFSPPSNER